MTSSPVESDFHVLIIGAGSVGLLIAQKLKTFGIKCTVFEREEYLNSRSREWNFGIYWAQTLLKECLPPAITDRLATAQVDPYRTPHNDDVLPIFNVKTGELLVRAPTPHVFRLNRPKFRTLIAEGVDIEYGKRLRTIVHPKASYKDKDTVTAIFEDGSEATGSLLIGADGSKSKVREYLLGPDKAALQPLPVIGCLAITTFPAELALKIRSQYSNISLSGYHPDGVSIFISLHDATDPEKPDTWEWVVLMTWLEPGTDHVTSPVEVRNAWDSWTEKLAEPFASAYRSVPEDTTIWCHRLAHWPTIAWGGRTGTVTLAGDAAHPMTYHRGQGLSNAVLDAAYLCRAIQEHCHDGKALADSIAAYEAEIVERGRNAVESSAENSMMVHDFDQMQRSKVFSIGCKKEEF